MAYKRFGARFRGDADAASARHVTEAAGRVRAGDRRRRVPEQRRRSVTLMSVVARSTGAGCFSGRRGAGLLDRTPRRRSR